MIDAKSPQRDRTEAWQHVVSDHPRVTVRRRRAQLESFGRQPRVCKELTERESPAFRAGPCEQALLGVKKGQHRFGVVTVPTGGVPRSPLPARERVTSVVDDRVEPLLALHEIAHLVLQVHG